MTYTLLVTPFTNQIMMTMQKHVGQEILMLSLTNIQSWIVKTTC